MSHKRRMFFDLPPELRTVVWRLAHFREAETRLSAFFSNKRRSWEPGCWHNGRITGYVVQLEVNVTKWICLERHHCRSHPDTVYAYSVTTAPCSSLMSVNDMVMRICRDPACIVERWFGRAHRMTSLPVQPKLPTRLDRARAAYNLGPH